MIMWCNSIICIFHVIVSALPIYMSISIRSVTKILVAPINLSV